jgi:hypothetical protein
MDGRYGFGKYRLYDGEWLPVIQGGADVPATRTQVFAALKETYGPAILDQVNTEPLMFMQFDDMKRSFGGKYWTAPARFSGDSQEQIRQGPSAVGSYLDGEEVSDAGAEVYKEAQVTPRFHYATIQVSGPAISASKTNPMAFAEQKTAEIQGKTEWLLSQLNGQCYGNGFGVMGRAGADPGASQVTIASTPAGNPDNPIPAMATFPIGAFVDIHADGSPIGAKRNTAGKKAGRKIQAVSGRTITYGGGDIAALVGNETGTGDIIVYEDAREGTIPASDPGKQLAGLAALIDDVTEGPQTLQNIDRNTFPGFRGTRMHNSNALREVSIDLLQTGVDTCRIKGKKQPDMIVSNYGLRRKYANLLLPDVRYAPEQLKGGFKVITFDGIDWFVDKDCSLGRIYFLRKDSLERFEMEPIGLLDEVSEGERVSKKDVYEFLVGGYLNLGVLRPNGNVKMTDLVDPGIAEGL